MWTVSVTRPARCYPKSSFSRFSLPTTHTGHLRGELDIITGSLRTGRSLYVCSTFLIPACAFFNVIFSFTCNKIDRCPCGDNRYTAYPYTVRVMLFLIKPHVYSVSMAVWGGMAS